MKNPTKEKAEEVVLKFMRIKTQNWFDKNIGKECALIYVNDIISECDSFDFYDCSLRKNYWNAVKQEIEKL